MDPGTARTAHLLPTGGTLSRGQWRQRHAVIVGVLAGHVPVLLVLGVVRGERPAHLAVELLLPVLAVVVARLRRLPDLLRAHAATLGLGLCSALLVHLTGASSEAHFHFFVVVCVVALYERWSVLLLAVAFTLVHHLGLSAVDPGLVFEHGAEDGGWPLWSLVHGLALGAQCAVAVAHWRAHEGALRAERRLVRRLLEREGALQEALRRADVDALASGVAHDLNTPVQYAADNARYLGRVLLELVDLAAHTSAALDALPAEVVPDGLRSVRERHRAHDREWDRDDVRQALGDCLSGLEEVARLVLELQDTAAQSVPAPRAAQDDGAGPRRDRRRRDAAASPGTSRRGP